MSQIEARAELSLVQKRGLAARLLREKAGLKRGGAGLVHRLIELEAARAPESVAVTCSCGSLTYFELNARANRLAGRLRGMGVGPEVLVGLCTDRSTAMVVGLLAVLKAGGAYVPIDPAYPPDRIAFMLDDACVSVLLTEQRLLDDLPYGKTPVVCLDSDWESVGEGRAGNVDSQVGGANLAYVIYTSGSTGRPKGVQVTHSALANLLQAMQRLLPIDSQETLLAVTTLSFDIAALEIFLPLIVGGRVELIDREEAADGARLASLTEDPGIAFLQATPATWRLLLEAGWQGNPTLTMLCGGEALPRSLADRLINKGAALWNLYGPTETTVWSSACRVEAGETPISIGRPIANTQLYVLDQRLRVVPVGVVGELYIGGAGLARGYRERPGLTAERFLPDPFGDLLGGRLYRTGDLARWRLDGSLECLGRVDHQVKIRGFRVELGEIEAALMRHEAVRETVVAARPDATGEASLAAYVVPRERLDPIAPGDLRRWLVDLIPEYMVPTAFVILDSLPLTPNGKVDRQALPNPADARLQVQAQFVPPRGPIEQAIAEIWTDLLGGQPVGAHDSFFERGGHSLLAVQLLARLRNIFNVDAPLRDFLDDPTVSRLGDIVERALADSADLDAPPLTRARPDDSLPTSFAQERLWFLDQLEPGQASYNVPSAVSIVGSLNVPALGQALSDVVRRHEVLRTTLVSERGIPCQVIAASLELPLELEDLSSLPEEERRRRAVDRMREEIQRPFDLARGPLVRACLLRMGEQEHIALVIMHHTISDGWSIGILIREISVLYESFLKGESSPLPELPIQYADYAVWQRSWLRGAILDAQIGYWTKQLAGLPDLELPADRPRRLVASRSGGERSTALPKATLEAVRALGRREGATLYMSLLAAFQVLLYRLSGQEDFAVGSPIAGRTYAELESLIGCFVNTLVMRADLSGDPSFRQLLRRVRLTAIEAYSHQDLPFERVVSIAHSDRNNSRPPLFQVMFVLQNAPMHPLRSTDLSLAPLALPSETSKFDITLFATEVAEGLRLTMEYSTDLFDASTVDRMLARYGLLLEEIVSHPDQPIRALQMLTEEERSLLLDGWNSEGMDLAMGLDEAVDGDLGFLMHESSDSEIAIDD